MTLIEAGTQAHKARPLQDFFHKNYLLSLRFELAYFEPDHQVVRTLGAASRRWAGKRGRAGQACGRDWEQEESASRFSNTTNLFNNRNKTFENARHFLHNIFSTVGIRMKAPVMHKFNFHDTV